VGETVSFVVQGIMRPEDALAKLRFERINNQMPCHRKGFVLSTIHRV
jgi:hypothetical protein